jgi:2-aminoethylphosphonate-pyruvate transaminase
MKSHVSISPTTRPSRPDEPRLVRTDHEPLILLCPGPVNTTARVKQAMARMDVAHRDRAFVELLDRLRARIKAVAGAPDYEALVVSGSATGATEAALATFIAADERLLVVSNGAFGERLAQIAEALELGVSHLRYDWGEPVVMEQIVALLDGDPRIKAVAMVHHETSVGVLNPVHEVGRFLAPRKIRYFIDVVSSLGAEEFDTVRARASVVIGSGNKCLHGVPGAAFVLVKPSLWRETAHVKPRSMYLDLTRYRGSIQENGQTPFTPAVPIMAALDEALRELEEEGGPQARRGQYLSLNHRLRTGLHQLGLRVRFDGPDRSASLVVAHLPVGVTFDQFYGRLRDRGFLVYRGKGPLSHDCFLVANMGHLNLETIDRFLEVVASAIGIERLDTERHARSQGA